MTILWTWGAVAVLVAALCVVLVVLGLREDRQRARQGACSCCGRPSAGPGVLCSRCSGAGADD
ncbi:MAG: hypothetical protein FJ087_21950 [Deltaproteobacteria bacterium]|nr:hypothetical protein [Deltaproteobacteria bacterium]